MGAWNNRCAVVLCSMLLFACSSVKEELKPAALQDIEAKLRLNSIWSKQVSAGQDARYERLQPAYVEGKLIVADVKGKVVALDADTGKRLWRSKIDRDIGGGVGIAGDLALLGTLDGHVVALQLSDGAIKWQSKAGSEVVSAPQGNADVSVAVSIDGRVQAYATSDGEEIWNYDHSAPILSLRSTADPLVNDNFAFVSFDNGQMLCFDVRSGQMKWSLRIAQPQGKTELDRLVDADSSPLSYGPYIYGASYNGRLVAAASGTGRISWAQELSTFNHFTISDNVVVVVDHDSHIMGIDASTGSLLWSNEQLHRRALSAPAVFGSAVFSVDQQGYAHGLTLADGKIVARTRVGKYPVLAQPIIEKDMMFVYDTAGNLSAFGLEQGNFSISPWSLPTNRHRGAIATKRTGLEG